ncbi:MAG: MopE-related protein [Pseudomonadota bacterium]|nr:MopE-related protein [Pseudomonadota bacterium]
MQRPPRHLAAFFALFALVDAACTSPADKADDTADDTAPESDTDTLPVDADGDGSAEPDDCDDDNAGIHPDAAEVCDAVDQDCDGEVDEGAMDTFWADADGDGFGDSAVATTGCELPEAAVAPGAADCDDADAAAFPGALEACGDGVDQDCDGADVGCVERSLADAGFIAGDIDLYETGARLLVVPDMNGDGTAELAIGASRTFDGALTTQVSAGPLPIGGQFGDDESEYDLWAHAAGDLDGDGAGDLYFTAGDASGGGYLVSSLFDGSGSDGALIVDRAHAGAVADLDGDGQDDLLTTRTSDGPDTDLGAFLGPFSTVRTWDDAVATWSGPSSETFAEHFAAVDLDGDGVAEVIVTESPDDAEPAALVFAGLSGARSADDADARLSTEGTEHPYLRVQCAGDLDGDGLEDLLVHSDRVEGTDGRVWLYGGAPSGDIALADLGTGWLSGEPGSSVGTAVTTGDLDADGAPDLVVSEPDAPLGRIHLVYGPVSVGWHDLSGADLTWVSTDLVEDPGDDLAVGDFNGDGMDDLVIGAAAWGSDQGGVYVVAGAVG